MEIGVSTASLFPRHTEKSLLDIARLGIKNVEIFLGSIGELGGEILLEIKSICNEYELNVMSVHPFSSPLETVFLFSSYERRLDEILDLYKRYFDVMNVLGAKIFVVHGAILSSKCPDDRYIERLSKLVEIGRGFGVIVGQENVNYCKSGDLNFLKMLSKQMGDSFSLVLDVKQARRCGYNPVEFVEALGKRIVHLHLSDGNRFNAGEGDCLLIGKGNCDFKMLFSALKRAGFSGDGVVELYRENFSHLAELSESVDILKKISKFVENSCN